MKWTTKTVLYFMKAFSFSTNDYCVEANCVKRRRTLKQ